MSELINGKLAYTGASHANSNGIETMATMGGLVSFTMTVADGIVTKLTPQTLKFAPNTGTKAVIVYTVLDAHGKKVQQINNEVDGAVYIGGPKDSFRNNVYSVAEFQNMLQGSGHSITLYQNR